VDNVIAIDKDLPEISILLPTNSVGYASDNVWFNFSLDKAVSVWNVYLGDYSEVGFEVNGFIKRGFTDDVGSSIL
jgi:predicted ATPase